MDIRFAGADLFQSLEVDKGQYDDNCEVFWATGACLFVRAEMFIKAWVDWMNGFLPTWKRLIFAGGQKMKDTKLWFAPNQRFTMWVVVHFRKNLRRRPTST